VIATGSKPRRLPFAGADLMITSDDVLSERKLPASVVFIGGGVIALEFSHVYARAGAQVTILEMLPRLLDNMDADAVAQLGGETERIGVAIHTGVEVQRIEQAADRFRVVYVEDGSERSVEAERVVHGAGRVADLDDLDLTAGRVEAERGRSISICGRPRTRGFLHAGTLRP
jgi:glutathione reductase (NADPH)